MKKFLLSLSAVFLLAVCLFVLPVKADAATIASGGPDSRVQLGRDLYWELDESGILTIWGSGSMNSFSNTYCPWLDYRDQIEYVVVKEGVLSIGDCAFYECRNLTTVELAESVGTLGMYTFRSCENLRSLTFGKKLWKVGMYTFNGCSSLDDPDAPGIFYTGTPDSFADIQTYGGCEWIYCDKTYIARIYQQPEDALVKEGTPATVTVCANGADLTYTWYVKKPGGTFVKDPCMGSTYAFTMTQALSGTQAYCVVTNSYGHSVQSNTVVMKIQSAAITKQPENVTAKDKTAVKVSVTAAGDSLKYQWYYADKGAKKFSAISGATSATYGVTLTTAMNGRRVYCVVTDKYGNTAQSDTVTLNVTSGAKITKQPVGGSVKVGETITVTVGASGEGLTYAWYYADKGQTDFIPANVTTSQYSVEMNYAVSGRRVYCVVTDKYGYTATSKTVEIGRTAYIMYQSDSMTIPSGCEAYASVSADGEGLTYQWYYAKKGSKKYTKIKSAKSDTYKVTMSSKNKGRRYYCLVTDKYGNTVKTEPVTLNMQPVLKITKQPKSVKVASGKYAKVTVKASGSGLQYTWYYAEKGSQEFRPLTKVTGNTYKLKMTSKNSGRRVYCVVTDKYGCIVESKIVTLSVKQKAKITKQPSTTVKAVSGQKAEVTVKATGDGLKYQWYYANKGATKFKKLSSAKSATYSVKMTSKVNGRRVYCKITDKYGNTVKTKTVTLKLTKATVTATIKVKHSYNKYDQWPYEMNLTVKAKGGTGKYTYTYQVLETKNSKTPSVSETYDWNEFTMWNSNAAYKKEYMRVTIKDSKGCGTSYLVRLKDGKVLSTKIVK